MPSKDNLIVVGILCFILLIGAVGGTFSGFILHELRKPRGSIRVSQQALQEINLKCSGMYRDLAVNREYVYANCYSPSLTGGKALIVPITMRNVEMQQ